MTHKRADKQELGKLFLNIPVLALIQKQIISPHNKKKKKKLACIQICEKMKIPISKTYIAGLWEGFSQMTCIIKIFIAFLAQEKLMAKQLLASNNFI